MLASQPKRYWLSMQTFRYWVPPLATSLNWESFVVVWLTFSPSSTTQLSPLGIAIMTRYETRHVQEEIKELGGMEKNAIYMI